MPRRTPLLPLLLIIPASLLLAACSSTTTLSGDGAAGRDQATADARSGDGGGGDQSTVPAGDSALDAAPADVPGVPDLPAGDATAPDCAKLEADFAFALDALKECAVGCGCCTQEVIGIIFPGCPCPTYVSPQHATMISKLDALRAQFAKLGCPGPVCKCKRPASGECIQPPGATIGHCADRF